MAQAATDIVSVERLLRDLRIDDADDQTNALVQDLIVESVDYVSGELYPLIDDERWLRFRWVPGRDWCDARFRALIPGLLSIEEAGWWGFDDGDSQVPPNSFDAVPTWSRYTSYGIVDLYPDGGEWPDGVRMLGFRVKRGWQPGSPHAQSIARAVILWAKELFDDSPGVPANHPFYSILDKARPRVPVKPVAVATDA